MPLCCTRLQLQAHHKIQLGPEFGRATQTWSEPSCGRPTFPWDIGRQGIVALMCGALNQSNSPHGPDSYLFAAHRIAGFGVRRRGTTPLRHDPLPELTTNASWSSEEHVFYEDNRTIIEPARNPETPAWTALSTSAISDLDDSGFCNGSRWSMWSHVRWFTRGVFGTLR